MILFSVSIDFNYNIISLGKLKIFYHSLPSNEYVQEQLIFWPTCIVERWTFTCRDSLSFSNSSSKDLICCSWAIFRSVEMRTVTSAKIQTYLDISLHLWLYIVYLKPSMWWTFEWILWNILSAMCHYTDLIFQMTKKMCPSIMADLVTVCLINFCYQLYTVSYCWWYNK